MTDNAIDAPQTTPSMAAHPAAATDTCYARWAIIGIFLILFVAGIVAARDFLVPVVVACLLTLMFTPLRRFLNRLGAPSWFCAVIVLASLLTAGTVGVATLSGPVAQWIEDAPSIGWRVEQKIRNLRKPVESIVEAGKKVDELADGKAAPDTQKVQVKEKSMIQRIAASAPGVAAQIAFVLVLLFFLVASGDMFYEKLVHVLPTLTDKRRALKIAFDIEQRLARYFSTVALINATLGVVIALAMSVMGMPSPALLGLIAFLLNFIPFVGSIIGVCLVTVIGIVALPELWMALTAGSIYLTLTAIEGQLITPYFVGRSLKLNTVVVFLSVALWAWLWSAVGMFIAVPVLVVIRVFSEHIPALGPLGDFLSARGVETDRDVAPAKARPKLSDG
jgi:predicted PurR-regulated permease PerM